MGRIFWGALATDVATAGAAVAFVTFGLYDVGATKEHTQFLYSLMESTMHASVRRRAAQIVPPSLTEPARVAEGAACFREHCVVCHGAPGVAQGAAGQGMQPLPGPLVDATRRWQPRELYWITRHGIKMSGMPAWEFRFTEGELWSVVAFLDRLPALGAADYASLAGSAGPCPAGNPSRTPPVHERSTRDQALLALRQHACTACHDIPGAVDSEPQVGPPLAGFGKRTTIAGVVPNTRDNLVRWIQSPGVLKPGTAMPALQVGDEHARQIADYLLGLK
jgi:cytochrome c1